jgi:hypothetical protein
MFVINTDQGYIAGEFHNGLKFVDKPEARRFTYDELTTYKKEILNELTGVFDELLKRGIELQRKLEKGKMGFISIFFLRSSIITESYEIMISMYEKGYYFDRKPLSISWKPMFIMKYFIDDMKYFEKAIKSKIIRVQKSEINKVKMHYCEDYFQVIKEFFLNYIDEITSLNSFKELEKEEDIKITLGEFMDQNIVLYPDPFAEILSLFLPDYKEDKQ